MQMKRAAKRLCFSNHLPALDPFKPESLISSLDLCFLLNCGFHEALTHKDSKWLMADSHRRAQIPQNHTRREANLNVWIWLIRGWKGHDGSSHINKLQTCWHRKGYVLQYLGRLKWNLRRTVLETAELFWQTGHRSTWPGLCAQCSWNLITWREGDHGRGWCNHTDKAGPWCVILAVMLILRIYSNWTPERILPMCVCVDVYVGASGYVILGGSWE